MSFSLAACGRDKETSNNNELQTNNSGSQQETEDSQIEDTSESSSESQKVELTLDNRSEYFEIVGEIGTSTYPNGEDKPDYIYFLIK